MTDTRLLTTVEAAAYLGINPSTLRDFTMRKMVPAVRVGRLLKYRQADVERFVASNLTGKARAT